MPLTPAESEPGSNTPGATGGATDFDDGVTRGKIKSAPGDRFGGFVIGTRDRFVLRLDRLDAAGPS